jgi:hypothetical protein
MRTSSVGMDSSTCVRRNAWASGCPSVRIIGGSALLALILLLSTAVAKADVYTFTLTSTSPAGFTGTGSVTVDPSQCSAISGLCSLPADSHSATGLTAFSFTFDGQTFTPLNTCDNTSICGGGSGREVGLYISPPPPVQLDANLALGPSGETYELYLDTTNETFAFGSFDNLTPLAGTTDTSITGTYAGVLATPEPNEIVPLLMMVAILGFFLLRRRLREGSSCRRIPGPAGQL